MCPAAVSLPADPESLLRTTLLLAVCLSSSTALATEVGEANPFGLGLVIGEPTGITAKYYLSPKHALDATVGRSAYDRNRNDRIWLSLVYLWHPSVLHNDPAFELGWHFGVGGFISDRNDVDDVTIGARVPVGLDFTLEEVPLQFFLDLSADVELLPNTLDISLGLGLGGRYFF